MKKNKDKSLCVHWVLSEREVTVLAIVTACSMISGIVLTVATRNVWFLLLILPFVFPFGYLFVDSYAE